MPKRNPSKVAGAPARYADGYKGEPSAESLFLRVCDCPSIYVDGSAAGVYAYIRGYDSALSGAPLMGFREWLIVRGTIGNNQAWEAIMHNPGVTEDEKIPTLRALLEGFFEFRQVNGITRVYHEYAAWLLRRSWYTGPLRASHVRRTSARKPTR